MDVLGLLSSEFACSRLFRLLGGVYCPRCGSRSIKSHGRYRYVLKTISLSLVGGRLTIRQTPYSNILG